MRASQRKNDPNTDHKANQTPINERPKRRSITTKQMLIQTGASKRSKRQSTTTKQTPILSHSDHAELTSPPILHGSLIIEL